MQLTPFGRGWEWSRSLWMGWLLFPFGFTAFIPFLYIGFRMRQTKWIISGFIYLAIIVIHFIIDENFDVEHPIFDVSVGVVLCMWIAAWIQATVARRQYLRLLAQRIIGPVEFQKFQKKSIENQLNIEEVSLEEEENKGQALGRIEPKQKIVTQPPQAKRPLKQKNVKKKVQDLSPTIINVNRASVNELRALPSIDRLLAEQIIARRKKVKKFQSYTELVYQLNIQPHALAKAKPYLTFSDEEKREKERRRTETKATSEKRETSRRGRIVDY
ncbi:MAG TPA: helix-hairpin-helix domain-containing protein [Pseudogracilibacillus sp.]|nr:helix-hairpin-helix domain-containing protein [Pseudogracilibacillus sp.]